VTKWRLEGQAVEEKGLTRETTVELVDVVELDGRPLRVESMLNEACI
jgi:hypothetical protein